MWEAQIQEKWLHSHTIHPLGPRPSFLLTKGEHGTTRLICIIGKIHFIYFGRPTVDLYNVVLLNIALIANSLNYYAIINYL